MNFAAAALRSRLHAAVRSFFIKEGCLEVETPILSRGVIPEAPIELFETLHYNAAGDAEPLYLLPSPELHMKKLIAAGSGSIFQLGKSFRNGGEQGSHHNPEFTMLEWYQVEADYMDSIDTTERLFSAIASIIPKTPGHPPAERLRPPFCRRSVREAFLEYTGIDLLHHPDRTSFAAAARQIAGKATESVGGEEESWEDLFNRLLVQYVEPNLPVDRPTILYDYPAQIPALAASHPRGPWLERWELYLGSVELANCYSEERDPARIRDFFHRQYAEKARDARIVPDIDEEFLSLFETGGAKMEFPRCSGVAMGLDRLLMLLAGADSLKGVILFPFSDKI